MSLAADIAAFNARLDAAIADVMEHDIYNLALTSILAVIFPMVYDKYDSPAIEPYERRYDNGGLSDPRNIKLVGSGPVPNGYYIEVRDLAKDEDGLPLDEIIESGEGYHWKESQIYKKQPYPRPFYEAAEKFAVEGGWFANDLKKGLQDRGFTVDI